MIQRKVKGLRGLAIVLLATIVPTIGGVPVHASTVDDLRAYLGTTVAEREPTMITVPDTSGTASKNNGNTEKKNTKAMTTEQLMAELDKTEKVYEQGLAAATPAKELVDVLSSIKDLKDKIAEQEKLSKVVKSTNTDALIAASQVTNIEMQKSSALGTPNFNIGDVGKQAVSPTGKLLSIVTPYGYKINPDKSHEDKNTILELGAPVDTPILAQWNGKIAYIEKDEIDGCSIITLFHGQNLYTVYHHVIAKDIYVGKTINQGDILGTAGNTTKSEDGKSNHIGYQIILDNKYINPLLVFGDRGRTMYDDWLKHSYDTYTVEEGEEFYYKSSMSKDNINGKTPARNTIDGAAEIVGDYKLPDPGVVK